jgi:hypothetical protein
MLADHERALAEVGAGRLSEGSAIAAAVFPPYVGFRKGKLRMAKVRLGNRHWHLPQSKPLRIGIGIVLIGGGLLGFLPILGFWMIPLGLLVLSVDIPIVRRWRRQLAVWWHRDRKDGEGADPAAAEEANPPSAKAK